ncbi:MAG: hypothetical protein K8R69_02050 [Deltaproteobacteria bacterium]|nr:hypothetical protein [Deltaproteobacteria bacterium]
MPPILHFDGRGASISLLSPPRPLAGPSTDLRFLLARGVGQETLSGGSSEARRLESFWGSNVLREFESLEDEQDPQMIFPALLSMGRALVEQDRLEAAGLIFGSALELGRSLGPAETARAQRELDAIVGRGALGPRLEFQLRRFAREASSPSMLLGMTAASAVFQISRTAILSRLLASPGGSLFTRGFAARTVAGLGAFALEAPTFTLVGHGVRATMGEGTASSGSLGQELLGSYLSLGGLKLFGWMGQGATRWAGGGAFSRSVIPQISSYFGILAGHRLEQMAGLRPHVAGDTLFLDSLVTLLQFHVGGRLAGEMGGSAFGSWQRSLEWRGNFLNESASTRENPLLERLRGAFAPGGLSFAEASASSPEGLRFPTVFMMQGKGDGESPPSSRGTRETPSRNGAGRGGRFHPDQNAYQIVLELVRCRDRLRGRGAQELSLFQLMRQKMDEGKIAPERADELQWAVHSRALYENSPILQREFGTQDLQSIESTILRLNRLRESVAREQGQDSYSLATLTQAIAYGGRIPFEKMRSYLMAGASYDFFQQSPLLSGLKKGVFSDPYRLVQALYPLRREVEAARGHSYQLGTLIDALRWHPDFPLSRLQQYKMAGGASDFVGRLNLEKLRLDPGSLRTLTLEQVFLRLLHLRPVLLGESGDPVGIGYVLMGLRSHGVRKVRGGEINDSALTHAHVLDYAYQNWTRWGGHFRNLSALPKNGEGAGVRAGWTRPRYAQRYLVKDSGEPYSYSYVSNVVRWGEFLYEHREALALPPPEAVDVPPLLSTRRSRLMSFLEPHWDALRTRRQSPEDFLEELAGLRQEFLETPENGEAVPPGEPGEPPSLNMMVHSMFQAKGEERSRTLEVYAATVDTILQRWSEWRSHFRRLDAIPPTPAQQASRSRYQYAEAHLRQSNGESYSKNTLGFLLRWGSWVWAHRSLLGLRGGESTIPPPQDAEE